MTQITVLAAHDDVDVRDLIMKWTAHGLLRTSIWLDTAKLDPDIPVMTTPVLLFTAQTMSEVPLRDALGDTSYGLIRLIAIHRLDGDRADDQSNAALWELATRLDAATAEPTRLLRINLLVPDESNLPMLDRAIDVSCDVNVVVSPEDRPAEGSVNPGLDEPGAVTAHCTLAASTVGALWPQAGEGAFDEPNVLVAGQLGAIVVVRSSARVVDARSLPRSIASRMFAEGVGSLEGYQPGHLSRSRSDSKVVQAAARAFVSIDDGVLSYRPPARPEDPPRQRVLANTLRMLLQIWLQMTRIKLMGWSRDVLERLDEEAERWLATWIPLIDESPLDWRPTAADLTKAATTAPPDLQPSGLMPAVPPACPFLWKPLRELAFGLMDGGKMPDEIVEQWPAIEPRVSHPKWIAPRPEDRFVLTEEEQAALRVAGQPAPQSIRSCDRNASHHFPNWLSAALGSQVIDVCRRRFDEWRGRNDDQQSLVGLLAEHMDEQITIADGALRQRALDYEAETEAAERALQTLETLRDKLWRHTGFLLLFLLAAASWTTLVVTQLSVHLGRVLVLTGVVSTIGAVCWLAVLFGVSAKANAVEQDLVEIEARRKNTVAAVREWPTEAERLGSIYEILLDWGDIIGGLLHRPFGDATNPDLDSGSDEPTRPQAFRLGRGIVANDHQDLLAMLVAEKVFGKGWVSELYEVVADYAIPGRAIVDVPDERTEPDLSPSPLRASEKNQEKGQPRPQVLHARERLLTVVRQEHFGGPALEHFSGEIMIELLTVPSAQLFSSIEVLERRYDQTVTVPSVEFLPAIMPNPTSGAPCPQLARAAFSENGVVERRAIVQRVHLWGGHNPIMTGILPAVDHQQVTMHGEPEMTHAHRYLFTLARLDVSDGCDEDDLAIGDAESSEQATT